MLLVLFHLFLTLQYYLDGLLQAGQFPTEQGVRNVLNATVTCRWAVCRGVVRCVVLISRSPSVAVGVVPYVAMVVSGGVVQGRLGFMLR